MTFKLASDWPFDIRRLPFFYGWVIWVFSTIGFLFSVPGQTMGMAVFTEAFIEAMGMSRTELSLAYLFGTIASSLFLTAAGRWYDRIGGRLTVAISSFSLGVMVMFISLADQLAAVFDTFFVSFAIMFVGYFGVRFFGQGVLTSASRNVLLLWFVRRRGLVSGIRGVFVSLGFSLAPLLLAWLITAWGWRGALWVMAGVVGLVFPVFALIFLRDNPADCGVQPDGGAGADNKAAVESSSIELAEARRTGRFWIVSLSLAMHAMFGTALTFHVVSIFEAAGRGRDEAFGYFFPAAVFSTTVNLFASWLVDRHSLKPFVICMLAAFLAGAIGLYHLEETWGFWLLAAGFGSGGGLWGVISNLAFIRYFGPLHLGEISGFNTSLTVAASAVGPAAFSLALDFGGSYNVAVLLCMVILVALLAGSLFMPSNDRPIA